MLPLLPGLGAGFQRKSWAPGGPPGARAQPTSGSRTCGARGSRKRTPGLDLCSGPRKGRCCLHDVRFLSSSHICIGRCPGRCPWGLLRRGGCMRVAGGASFSRSDCGHSRTDAIPGAPQSPCSIAAQRRRDSPRTRRHGRTGRKVPADGPCY
uniref:Uncharacterized protein n=1 Tax=Rangifer tarandus platyrhynchus TaxID=3082113 RepID=A0ACB0E356_RANTA|nr:unnamed protein product [Rangifer tarandus platyrhynchus]